MYLRKSHKQALAFALLATLALGTVIGATDASASGTKASEFTLTSIEGPVSLSDFEDRVVLMFFGYTSCPDVCPVTLAAISKAFTKMTKDELQHVSALFISLDPERDTPELLEKYTGYFHSNIIGVTDNHEVLDKLLENYNVRFERKEKPESPLGYVISHTPDVLIVDRAGELQSRRIPPDATSQEIVAHIRSFL